MLRIGKMRISMNQLSKDTGGFELQPAFAATSRNIHSLPDVRLLEISEPDFPLGSWPEPWGALLKQKKPTRLNTQQVLNHVGLLVNGPPDTAGMPFI